MDGSPSNLLYAVYVCIHTLANKQLQVKQPIIFPHLILFLLDVGNRQGNKCRKVLKATLKHEKMEPTGANRQIHASDLGFPLRGALIHYSKFQNINN